ncbi:ExeM/NucH family extracellular endonuclease [Nocardioides humi]|uniref:ExeM/NucH family extracellular endonuclease n=1 Tax=Nocardioides humi TaxID=449461 RepID=A0ABN2B3A4_9ACTN|nr:ExeM/NucH family extracellular endonuclease [Nocardioides humi]
MRSAKQFLFGSLGVALAVSGLTALSAAPAHAVAGVFISEFHYDDSTPGDSGGVGEFVEVTAPAGTDLTGWTVQLVNGSNNSVYRTDGFSATIADQADGWGTVVVGYPPTTSGTVQNGSPDGIALIDAGGSVVEFISYEGEMTAMLGTPAVSVSSVDTLVSETNSTPGTDSLQRLVDGTWAGPAAHTRGVPNGYGDVTSQPLAATNPGNKSFFVDTLITPIALAATGGTPPYTWEITAGTLPDGLSLSGAQISGTPTAATSSPAEITVTVTDDEAATASTTFTVTVDDAPEIKPIAELQGTEGRSPYAPETGIGQGPDTVTTTGVVTGMYQDPAFVNSGFDGFTIQTGGTGGEVPSGGSNGIFVYYGNNTIPAGIEIGDSVQVTGRISEFYGLTEINVTSAGVVELGTPLPAVTPLATTFPTTDAEREALESMLIEPLGDFTVTNAYATNQYAEVGLAAGDEPLKQPTEFADATDEAAVQAIRDENAERAVTLDDGTGVNYLQNQTTKAQPVPWLTQGAGANPAPPRVGADVTFQAPVVLDYRNDTWKFQPQLPVTTDGAAVATFEDARAGDGTPQDVGGDLKLATFNVLNYFNTTGEAYAAAGPAQDPPLDTFCTYYTDRQSNRIGNNSCGVRLLDDPDTPTDESGTNDGRGPRGAATAVSLARQEAKLVHTINALGADIIALEEIENSIKLPGESNRDDALANLVRILNDAAGAGTWAYVKSPGSALNATAVAEQDTIRSAFIYRAAVAEPVGQSDMLFGTTEFANAREPLAQVFKAKGAPDSHGFAVIANHFKSKGDNRSPAPPATGDNANHAEVGAFNGDRIRQATRLVQYADDFAAARGVEPVFLVGDFNSYTMEEPIGVLTDADYEIVESDTPGEETYSYDGLSGSLDHVLANEAAMEMVTGADIWQINANEAASFQYSRHNYNVTDFWLPNRPWATSDHNPEVVGLDVPAFTPVTYKEVQILGTNDFHGRLLPDGGNAAGAAPFATAVEELRSQNPAGTVFVAAGDLIGASTFESFIQQDEPTIEALNAMGLEVSAAGNHEFDRSYADLVGRVQELADWEYIAANLAYDDSIATEDQLAKTWTTTLDGVQVGFVGAVTEDLPTLVNPQGIDGITVTDIVDATNAAAEGLKQAGAELVILLVHEGASSTDCSSPTFTDGDTTFGNIVQNTSADVDAIISGHTHLAYNCKYTVADWVTQGRDVTKRPVVSAGQYGTNLNQLVFKFDEDTGELKALSQEVIATAGVGYEADPDVQQIVDDAVDHAEDAGSVVLGTMDGPFRRATYTSSAGATENRGGESTLNNQVAEMQRWTTEQAGIETDIAFMNPGGLRKDMEGTANPDDAALRDVSYRQAADVQPFANTLVNMKLTGAQIEEVLEEQWQRNAQGGVPSRPFLRLGVSSGFTYTYTETPVTVSAPNSAPVNTFQGEVTAMWLDGEPVDAEQVYSVTVNSFLGGGGDNFWTFADGGDKVDTGKVDLEGVVDYMAQYDQHAPLAVDYGQRAVKVTFPSDAPTSYEAGDTVDFDIASWSMSATGDRQDGEVQVKLGEEVLGTFTVNNDASTTAYDNIGSASVSVTLPQDVPGGAHELTLYGPVTETAVPVRIEVPEAPETPVVSNSVPTVSGDPRVGQTLTATAGTWTPTPDSVGFQWYANGVPITGGTSATLRLTGAQSGAAITVAVTAHAAGFVDATAVSAQVGPVVKGAVQMSVKTKPGKIKLRKTRTKVKVTLVNVDGVPVTGRVKIKVKGQKAKKVTVVDGKAKVRLKRFTSTGAKKLKVTYLGSDALSPVKTKTTVWVVRR